MSLADWLLLWLARGALRRELLKLSNEKIYLFDGNHTDSDCGFELLHRLEHGQPERRGDLTVAPSRSPHGKHEG